MKNKIERFAQSNPLSEHLCAHNPLSGPIAKDNPPPKKICTPSGKMQPGQRRERVNVERESNRGKLMRRESERGRKQFYKKTVK